MVTQEFSHIITVIKGIYPSGLGEVTRKILKYSNGQSRPGRRPERLHLPSALHAGGGDWLHIDKQGMGLK
jgi:hypothetical protein